MWGCAAVEHYIVNHADSLVVYCVISGALDAEASGGVVETIDIRIEDAVRTTEIVPWKASETSFLVVLFAVGVDT